MHYVFKKHIYNKPKIRRILNKTDDALMDLPMKRLKSWLMMHS